MGPLEALPEWLEQLRENCIYWSGPTIGLLRFSQQVFYGIVHPKHAKHDTYIFGAGQSFMLSPTAIESVAGKHVIKGRKLSIPRIQTIFIAHWEDASMHQLKG